VLIEELPQLRHDYRTDTRMTPSLALLQTLLRGFVSQAIEALGVVKVEVVSTDARIQPEEILDSTQLRHRILDQLITVHYENLLSGEHFQPTMHIGMIEGDSDRSIGFVDGTVGSHNELLECTRHLLLLLLLLLRRTISQCGRGRGVRAQLRVIRYRPGNRLPHDQQQLDAAVHRADPLGHFGCHEIARTLLDGDLPLEGVGHFAAVPFQPLSVVVVTVKKVNLTGRLLYLRVQEEHLQQCPRAALAYADYNGLGKMAIRAREVNLGVGEEERRRRVYLP